MPAKPKRVRAEFYRPGETEWATSLWADLVEEPDAHPLFRLLHDYPHFHPQPGWRLQFPGREFEIIGVDGRNLTCLEVH